MQTFNKTTYVANGIMTFIESLINQHHADQQAVYAKVKSLCNEKLNLIEGNNPDRNR